MRLPLFHFLFPRFQMDRVKGYLCAHQDITPGQSIRSAEIGPFEPYGTFLRERRCLGYAEWFSSGGVVSKSQIVTQDLPYLRRYARALTGSQTSGDAYVTATLEAVIADPPVLDDDRHGERRPALGWYEDRGACR